VNGSSDATATPSFAVMRARSRIGKAMVASTAIIATTISSSISVKPPGWSAGRCGEVGRASRHLPFLFRQN
jgi:hypothetical protein